MENKKYLIEERILTSGFWYDLFEGCYVDPLEIVADVDEAVRIKSAIILLKNWKQELEEDEMLEEF